MMKKKDQVMELVDADMQAAVEEYFSDSSIDKPPREPKKPKKGQQSLIEEDEHEENVNQYLATQVPELFNFKLTLSLAATTGNTNPHTIPVACGDEIPHERIEEILTKQFNSDSFKRKLRAIVGEPVDYGS